MSADLGILPLHGTARRSPADEARVSAFLSAAALARPARMPLAGAPREGRRARP